MPNKKSIYIDAEWYIGGNIFLIGYCYTAKYFGQLYDKSLSKKRFLALLKDVKYIYIYGPDIGILEKYYGINLRSEFICINLLKVFRDHLQLPSYKLAAVEEIFGITRARVEYKKNIFSIWKDWKKIHLKNRILEYNREDVINMMILWKQIRIAYNVKINYLIENKLK